MPAGTSGGPNDALTAAAFAITVGGLALAQFSELVELSSGLDPSGLELGSNQRRGAYERSRPRLCRRLHGHSPGAARAFLVS